MYVSPIVRICYGLVLLVMAFTVPLWITICFSVFGIMTMRWYVESVIIVMFAEYAFRGFLRGGSIAWVLFCVILVIHLVYSRIWSVE